MRLLTKLELDKLIRRKYLLLGGLLLLGYSSFMFFSCCMNSSPTFPVETADGVEVTGRAAALYNKSVYEQYAGELTDEAVAHVLDDFVDLRDAHGEHSFNWPVIYDNFSIFRAADQADRERSEYGYISVADAGVLSFHSPLVFSFDYTWQTAFNILFNSNVVFAIFLLIVLAPVFSEEYSSGAANVILSTRYGKSTVIQAKFTAAFLIAAISAVIFCVVILLACGAYFAGFEGWNADIQTQFMSNQSQIPIRMNNLRFFLVVMLFYWLSAVGTAVLACCCSALCKKSLIALIMSGVLYFLPYFPMKLGGVLGEWMFIFPIWSAKAQWVLRTAEHKLVNLLPLSCEMPVWIVIFIHPSFHIGGFQMTETRAAYHKEVKTASFQGKSITVENLTPVLSPKARDKRKREIESCLYEVFVKYAPGRAQMH